MSFALFLERGGVYPDIKGSNHEEVLQEFIKALPRDLLPEKDKLLEAVLEREALMPTGIGNGIALPHPRNPLITDENRQFIAMAILAKPVNWNSLDGKPVHTLFLIVSASAKIHLKTLSEITFFSRQENFIKLLDKRAPLEEMLHSLREAEKSWY